MTAVRVGQYNRHYRTPVSPFRLQSVKYIGGANSATTTTAAAWSISLPVGTMVGDILVVAGRTNSASATTLTVPDGWVSKVDTAGLPQQSSWCASGALTQAHVDASAVTITPSASRAQIWSALVYRGFAAPTVADWSAVFTSTTAGTGDFWPKSSPTSVAPGDLLIYWLLFATTGTSSAWYYPAYSLRYNNSTFMHTVGGFDCDVAGVPARDKSLVTIGSTSFCSYTLRLPRV